MKKHTLEYIIQNALHEQTARVRVVIKQRFGSSDDQLDARAAGAVYGFRIKAFAKKTDDRVATQSEVYRAIGIYAMKDATIAKYGNRKYVILISDDQRDAERNYLYTFWVFPAVYFYDKLQNIYKTNHLDPSKGDVVTINAGVPFRIGDAHMCPFNYVKTHLQGQDKYELDPIKVKEFVKWANQVNRINKPISDDDMQAPDLTNLPDVVKTSENYKIGKIWIVYELLLHLGAFPP